MKYLGPVCEEYNLKILPELMNQTERLYFDELYTIEHTKLKPVAITTFVNQDHKILALKAAPSSYNGPLAAFARQKYGNRKDLSGLTLLELSKTLSPYGKNITEIHTDCKASYDSILKLNFPEAELVKHKFIVPKKKELIHQNKKKFDPLFPINHTHGYLRYQINRLRRRSWCTTKLIENLNTHLQIFLAHSNGIKI
jgi:hypothetical protein